jgi:hypothetical protein
MNLIPLFLNILLVSSYPISWFGSTTKAITNTAIEKLLTVSKFGVKILTEAAFENPRNAHQALNVLGEASGKQAAKNFKGSLRVAHEFGVGAVGEFSKVAKAKSVKAVSALKSLAERISIASRKWLSKIPGLKSLAPTVQEVVEHTGLQAEQVAEMSYFERIVQIYHGITNTIGSIQNQVAAIAAEYSHRAAVDSAKVGIALAGNQLTREADLKIAENMAEEILKSKPSDEIVREFGKDFAQRAMKQPLVAVKLTMSAASGFLPSLTVAYAKALNGFVQNTAKLTATLPTKSIKAANNALKKLSAKMRPTLPLFKRSIDVVIPQTDMEETPETLAIAQDLERSIKEFEELNQQLELLQNAHS